MICSVEDAIEVIREQDYEIKRLRAELAQAKELGTSHNSASTPLCPYCKKDAVYSKAFGWFCNDCGWWTKQRT